uniref:DUF4349 domain-containing protein n=1 Tax=Eubacterium cellulosolvens TaxID=29322 RepID=UPI000481910F|nr:DUF4349 domain-containing protein [[Eubacterium] cellulosolvens]
MKKKMMILLLAASIGFAGCGSDTKSSTATYKGNDYESTNTAGAAYDAEYATEDAAEVDAADGADGPTSTFKAKKSKESNEKLVYTGTVDIQTLEYDKSVKSLKKKIDEYDGIIQNESQSSSNYDWYTRDDNGQMDRRLSMSVRIPSKDFQKFVDSLSEQGQVMSTSVNTDNISQAYADTTAYVEGLEKEQKRLLEMMDKAQTIEEMIQVEDRLTEVETQLNQGKTDIASMNKDVDLSTVNITMKEVTRYDDIKKPENFGQKVVKAFKQSFTSFVSFVQELIIVLIMLLPGIVVVLLIVLLIIFLSKKKKKKRMQMNAGNVPGQNPQMMQGMPGAQNPQGMPPVQQPQASNPQGQNPPDNKQ